MTGACAAAVLLASCGRASVHTRDSGPAAGTDTGAAPVACASPLVWSEVAGSPAGYRISGSGPDDLWLIAAAGDGGAPCTPNDVSGTLACRGILMRGDGVSWTPPPGLGGNTEALGLWVAGRDDVFVGASGNKYVLHWNGSQWSQLPLGDNREVDSLWGSGPDDVWGARSDGGYLGHWDGNTWAHVDSVNGGVLAGGAPGDFWAGIRGALIDGGWAAGLAHHEPGTFDPPIAVTTAACLTPAQGDIYAIVVSGWANATDDVWFVGNHTYHYDGASWTCVPTPATSILHGVWGSSSADVWAVGEAGTILHFDGVSWSAVPSPTGSALYGVWASGPCDVWAIGDAVYHARPGVP